MLEKSQELKVENLNQVSKYNELLSWIYLIIFALSIRFFVIEPFCVPTGSMKMTILENDYIFSTKYSYGFSKHSFPFSPNIFKGRIFAKLPERGDIIIFRPPFDMDKRFIKRLIGLPGDKIQLIDNVTYINGKPIQREDLGIIISEQGNKYRKFKETLPNKVSFHSYKFVGNNDKIDQLMPIENDYQAEEIDNNDLLAENINSQLNHGDDLGNTKIFEVPEDHYFFMGDNRDNSEDSRVRLGFVPFENFIAKAQIIFFSTKEKMWDDKYTILQCVTRVWDWLTSIRFNRIFSSLYKL